MTGEPVVIAGAGPAGLAAAIQLRRSGIDPLVLERAEPGGLLRSAGMVENHPGFPDGISGPDLVRLIVRQAERWGVRIRAGEATALFRKDDRLEIRSTAGTFTARAAVIATGTKPRLWTGPAGAEEAEDRIDYEIHAIRDARDERIAVIGAGDAAFDYALTLSERNDVFLMNRGRRTRCLPLLKERALARNRVRYEEETVVKEIRPAAEGGWELRRTGPGGGGTIAVDRLVAAVGRVPNLEWTGGTADDILRGDHTGNLHLVGDAGNGEDRQTAVAAGEGVRAAMRIARYLGEESS